MKIKTLLPILGLTSVAAAAPVVASCAQPAATGWVWVQGLTCTNEHLTIEADKSYTFDFDMSGMKQDSASGFAFSVVAAAKTLGIADDSVTVKINSEAISEKPVIALGVITVLTNIKKTDTLSITVTFTEGGSDLVGTLTPTMN